MARPKDPLIKPAQATAKALELIDRDGLESFNIRNLAHELGVNPSSLYHHFRDKRDILDRVCRLVLDQEHVVSELPAQAIWQEYVKESVRRYRRTLMRHPNVAPLMSPPSGERFGDPLSTKVMEKLLADGVPRKYVYAIVDSVNTLAYGSAILNPAGSAISNGSETRPGGALVPAEVARAAPRSRERIFQLQVEALLEGWTSILARDTGGATNKVIASRRQATRAAKRAIAQR